MSDVEGVTIKLSELLRHPEDLDKIPGLKAEFLRKKAAVDSQLKHGLKEQLEVTQAGMNNISEGQRTVNAIKEEMMKIDKLCAEAQNMIRDLPHINLVATTHRNFEQVEKMKRDIDSFEERLEHLEMLLREDDQDPENQPHLLEIHYGLSQLRDIRDHAMEQAKSSDACLELINNLRLETGATLQDYFTRLDDVIDWFDGHVGNACMNLIPLVQSGNAGMVVRLALIIEEEEKKDARVQALQDVQSNYKDLASKFRSVATGTRELRKYKEKFLQAIEMSAQSQLETSNEVFIEDPDKLSKSVRWFFNDLNAVKLGMVSLVPRKWKIYKKYVDIYHKIMHDWLVSHIDDQELKPTHMLAIIHWVDKYYEKMSKLAVAEEDLQPHVIDNRSPELVREYRQLIIKAVEEWMDRMAETDKQTFLARAEGTLDTDENGCFRTKTLGDMWRMLREQLLVAGSSDRTDVTEGVVDAMFRALTSRQRMWESLVDAELTKYSSSPDMEGLQPLQDWVVAIANDQIACIDDGDEASEATLSYLTRFARDYSPLVSPQYNISASSQLDALKDGYIDLGTHCITVFSSVIFAVDFRTILPEFFTPLWYQQQRMGQIVSTFKDYLTDYEAVLSPYLRDVLTEELADSLLVAYLSSVHNKGARFRRGEPFVEKIRDDVVTVFTFFESFGAFQDIKNKWRAVEGMCSLLESDKTSLPLVYERFKRDYWDAQMGWIEAALRARDDFERSMLRDVKARAAEISIERGVETIMGKVK